ncbi:hypothetical protein EVAR_23007_1 [Eumeta japonica]|uniref:Uncharacterized protein n=1 Tax=Eumeta variegata TaxID=151549 RepID=A0A4C1URD9_EUMVA|nr:hypothetical protein EVAR_23007_1 [Eumeta japonica]
MLNAQNETRQLGGPMTWRRSRANVCLGGPGSYVVEVVNGRVGSLLSCQRNFFSRSALARRQERRRGRVSRLRPYLNEDRAWRAGAAAGRLSGLFLFTRFLSGQKESLIENRMERKRAGSVPARSPPNVAEIDCSFSRDKRARELPKSRWSRSSLNTRNPSGVTGKHASYQKVDGPGRP